MRILLVKPPERSQFNFGTYSLGVLASAIRDIADVSILDATDTAPGKAVQNILSQRPDLVGVTVMGMRSVGPATDFIMDLKKSAGYAVGRPAVIAGGHGATMMPSSLLKSGADAVVLGEGEFTLRMIVEKGVVPGVPGLACRCGDDVIVGPPQKPIKPLGVLKMASRDLMPPPPDGVHLMETSRGCPHSCRFCETTRFYGKTWRPHSPERVADEVRILTDDYNAWIIHFADDNFAANPGRVLEISERLMGNPAPVFFMASARGDDLLRDPKLIPAMAAARISRITVGVETVEPEMTKVTGKSIALEAYRELFARMREHGMFSVASYIIGLPGEEPEMRSRVLELAVETGADSSHFLPFLPLPGIPLSTGRKDFAPEPADVAYAEYLNDAFPMHPAVIQRMKDASSRNDTRGMLARATLCRKMAQVATNI